MTRRALVLGGGGVTGIAWMWGIVAGLAEAGVDLSDTDLVIGTSAGSVVGAQVAHRLDAAERFAAQLAPADHEIGAAMGAATMLRLVGAAVAGRPRAQDVRARIGRVALRTPTVDEQVRIDVIRARLPVHDWPGTPLRVTAVDAETGEFRTFSRESGVSMVSAVAASCAVPAVWPPVTIDGRRYVDGGVRSAVNADLALGYERVVVLAPITSGAGPMEPVGRQVATLRTQGRVVLVTPDAATVAAMGRNMLDPARRAPSARAGHAQATDVTDDIRRVWG